MNSEYKVFKFKSENLDDFNDHISIEEPVEIIIKYKDSIGGLIRAILT